MNRRHLLSGALAAPLLLPAARAADRGRAEPSFRFAFVTDCHIQPELQAADGCRQCFRAVARGRYDFVIQGGDHVYDALEVDRARANRLMDLYVETEQAIGSKVHHVLGNHDCFGVFPTSGIAPSAPDYGKQYYIERFGPTYYAFDHKGVHFVVLDSIGLTPDRSYEGRIDPAQLAWLARDLAAQPKGTRIIVATHIPIVTALSIYEPEEWTRTPHNWTNVVNAREVLRVLRPYHVIAVLQGHSHVAETVTLNGIPFITGGAVSGNWWQGSFLGTDEGYMDIAVDGDQVISRYRGFGFRSIDRHDVII
ncbi:metallophosphoesterase family protein [Sphingomonas sp. Leaf4]|uniref:metallophosphoesterase family protein n=1 Tax=Sphingomonas sp. Leaf4 TaxID=2876553 RepID=UPI001E3742D3|nr:metallophosphoesterase [Sphingomonas sp. Leaf4]